MTLRLRLVLALAVLVAAGLGVFGFATYSLYARARNDSLEEQLRASVPFSLNEILAANARSGPPFPGTGTNEPGTNSMNGTSFGRPPDADRRQGGLGGPPVSGLLDTYAELREPDGTVLATKELRASSAAPALPSDPALLPVGRVVTVPSTDGTTEWLVLAAAAERGEMEAVIVVATPLSEVQAALSQLVLVEGAAGGTLLALLVVGSWLILRRGLRPLEHMASTANSISGRSLSAGDVVERVSPADDRTEIGQLGLALNTMIDGIDVAFRERDGTEQRLRQFLADASHELRTPLTSIQGFAELYRIGSESPGTGATPIDLGVMMRRIEEESARMKGLVEDLLLLARLDQTRPAQRSPVDLSVLAADACTDAAAVAPDRSITLDAEEPTVVLGDEDHLRQALANLVTNARTHTPAGTAIDVRAALVDGGAVVTVRDHGDGLPPEGLEKAFDRFWQADSARVGHGAGLGLAIVAAIAREHGGRAVARNHPEGGAEISIELPVLSPVR